MKTSLMTEMQEVKRVIAHHAAYQFEELPIVTCVNSFENKIKSAIKVFEMVDGWHEKNWKTGCGYHYVIGNGHGIEDGHVNLWRPKKYLGAQCRGQNHDSIGIMLMGNLAKVDPTPRQVKALTHLFKNLCIEYNLDPVGYYDEVRFGLRNVGKVLSGHKDWREHGSNSCPGSLHGMFPEIREAARKLLILESPISTVYCKGELTREGESQ